MHFKPLWESTSFEHGKLDGDQVIVTPIVAFVSPIGVVPAVRCNGSTLDGFMYPERSVDLLNAWRITQMLPGINWLRHDPGRQRETLAMLVDYACGDASPVLLLELADDFGISPKDTKTHLDEHLKLFPGKYTMKALLERLPPGMISMSNPAFGSHLQVIDRAVASGDLELTERSRELLDIAREQEKEFLKEWEELREELKQPIDPTESFELFLRDIGGLGKERRFIIEGIGPLTGLGQLDDAVRRLTIRGAPRQLHLLEDPRFSVSDRVTTNVMHRDGVTIYKVDYRVQDEPPSMTVGKDRIYLHDVHYQKGGKFFLACSRHDADFDGPLTYPVDTVYKSVGDLRKHINYLLGKEGLLPAGMDLFQKPTGRRERLLAFAKSTYGFLGGNNPRLQHP